MINREPRWSIKITHTPTGIEVIRTSDLHRTQREAYNSAISYLKSRLFLFYNLEINQKDIIIEGGWENET